MFPGMDGALVSIESAPPRDSGGTESYSLSYLEPVRSRLSGPVSIGGRSVRTPIVAVVLRDEVELDAAVLFHAGPDGAFDDGCGQAPSQGQGIAAQVLGEGKAEQEHDDDERQRCDDGDVVAGRPGLPRVRRRRPAA